MNDTLSVPNDPNAPPLPLELTDPELAGHIQLISAGKHPVVKSMHFSSEGNVFVLHNGEVVRPGYRPVRIGRNDPCPCGSGKKYKKCCLT